MVFQYRHHSNLNSISYLQCFKNYNLNYNSVAKYKALLHCKIIALKKHTTSWRKYSKYRKWTYTIGKFQRSFRIATKIFLPKKLDSNSKIKKYWYKNASEGLVAVSDILLAAKSYFSIVDL